MKQETKIALLKCVRESKQCKMLDALKLAAAGLDFAQAQSESKKDSDYLFEVLRVVRGVIDIAEGRA